MFSISGSVSTFLWSANKSVAPFYFLLFPPILKLTGDGGGGWRGDVLICANAIGT